jgi:hypothetical protein
MNWEDHMDTSDSKDANGQTPESEIAQLTETLFGYSKKSDDRNDAGDVDVDVSSLE